MRLIGSESNSINRNQSESKQRTMYGLVLHWSLWIRYSSKSHNQTWRNGDTVNSGATDISYSVYVPLHHHCNDKQPEALLDMFCSAQAVLHFLLLLLWCCSNYFPAAYDFKKQVVLTVKCNLAAICEALKFIALKVLTTAPLLVLNKAKL